MVVLHVAERFGIAQLLLLTTPVGVESYSHGFRRKNRAGGGHPHQSRGWFGGDRTSSAADEESQHGNNGHNFDDVTSEELRSTATATASGSSTSGRSQGHAHAHAHAHAHHRQHDRSYGADQPQMTAHDNAWLQLSGSAPAVGSTSRSRPLSRSTSTGSSFRSTHRRRMEKLDRDLQRGVGDEDSDRDSSASGGQTGGKTNPAEDTVTTYDELEDPIGPFDATGGASFVQLGESESTQSQQKQQEQDQKGSKSSPVPSAAPAPAAAAQPSPAGAQAAPAPGGTAAAAPGGTPPAGANAITVNTDNAKFKDGVGWAKLKDGSICETQGDWDPAKLNILLSTEDDKQKKTNFADGKLTLTSEQEQNWQQHKCSDAQLKEAKEVVEAEAKAGAAGGAGGKNDEKQNPKDDKDKDKDKKEDDEAENGEEGEMEPWQLAAAGIGVCIIVVLILLVVSMNQRPAPPVASPATLYSPPRPSTSAAAPPFQRQSESAAPEQGGTTTPPAGSSASGSGSDENQEGGFAKTRRTDGRPMVGADEITTQTRVYRMKRELLDVVDAVSGIKQVLRTCNWWCTRGGMTDDAYSTCISTYVRRLGLRAREEIDR
eukprot:CAMPEP_0179009632 /NCGR_PEP_ID=MMETSP0795-20121207/16376_1 /TAXON_ID=88552 /ORGANISM="Amoebophrya sp., Strain Ameob2" /LENGTH=599 /DNA_ID=CAMNT_0020704843 /DNA_START=87 /DNA_END=1887 /DNA_ORIENTATION=-